jgi:drug/metabolite transporter (DMT)-like permease
VLTPIGSAFFVLREQFTLLKIHAASLALLAIGILTSAGYNSLQYGVAAVAVIGIFRHIFVAIALAKKLGHGLK